MQECTSKTKKIARRTEEMKRNEANKGEVRAKKKREINKPGPGLELRFWTISHSSYP